LQAIEVSQFLIGGLSYVLLQQQLQHFGDVLFSDVQLIGLLNMKILKERFCGG